MPRGGWLPLCASWTPSQGAVRWPEGELRRAVFAPRFWDGSREEASGMPISNPLRRWRRPDLPPVDAPLLPDDEGHGGAGGDGGVDAHAEFANPMASPFGQDAVQHSRVLRWDDGGGDDSESAGGGNSCAHPASCLPPLLHRRRHSSAGASASASRSRSGGSMLALQSLSSRRLAAAAAAVPEPPDSSPPRAQSGHVHQEDMSQASEWLFGSGAPEFLEHASSWGTVQLTDAAPDRRCSPLLSGPGHKAGSRAATIRQRLCCCIAPSAVQQ